MADVIFKINGVVVGTLNEKSEYVPEPGCPPSFGDGQYGGVPKIYRSDKAFMAGRKDSDIHGPLQLARMRVAEQAGVSTTGKVYLSTLARFPGDPEAWISDAGDVRRIARERNWRVTGAVEHEPHEEEPPPPIDVADDIVGRRVAKVLAVDPTANVDEVWARQKDLASGKVDLHPPLCTDHNFDQPVD